MCEIKSVVLYKTHIDAFKQLPPEQFKATILALCDYAIDGTLPEDDPVVYAMVMLAKHAIDARNAKIENGAKGGRSKNQTKANENQTETKQNQTEPNTEQKNQLQVTSYKLQDKDNKTYNAPFADIVDYLNSKAGTAYRATSDNTRRHIQARWNEKYTLDDFKKVIDNKVAEWKDTEMERFLRPETLFGRKFESYLNGKAKPHGTKNRFNNFHQREYDFDALERSVLSNASNAVR